MADTVKHTPGPWAISGRSAACIRTADQDQRIAYLETADNTFEVCEANGRLIAAAPDLLEALKGMLVVGNLFTDSPYHEAARAAIAKAEGGS